MRTEMERKYFSEARFVLGIVIDAHRLAATRCEENTLLAVYFYDLFSVTLDPSIVENQ